MFPFIQPSVSPAQHRRVLQRTVAWRAIVHAHHLQHLPALYPDGIRWYVGLTDGTTYRPYVDDLCSPTERSARTSRREQLYG